MLAVVSLLRIFKFKDAALITKENVLMIQIFSYALLPHVRQNQMRPSTDFHVIFSHVVMESTAFLESLFVTDMSSVKMEVGRIFEHIFTQCSAYPVLW